MRLLVTGGSGFIGTNVVEEFVGRGCPVLSLDVAAPRISTHLLHWKKVDLLNPSELGPVVEAFRPTHVLHLAARTDLKGKTPADYALNTIGTRNLIEALRGQRAVERVLFTSSMLVCKPGYIPRDDLDFSHVTPYGQSKAEMELGIRAEALPYTWCILRPTSIWGPWFGPPYKDFFDRVISRRMYNIRGRSCVKTYGFVLNAVFQIGKLLSTREGHGAVFYIGDQPPLNIAEWADLISAKLGYRAVPTYPYLLFNLAALMGDVLTLCGLRFPMTSFRLRNMTTDNVLPLDRLHQLTGDSPYNTEQAVEITLNWIKEHS